MSVLRLHIFCQYLCQKVLSPPIKAAQFLEHGLLDITVICRFRRQTHVTPKSFLSFLEGYKSLYADKLANLNELAGRMTTGLLKLNEASESVDELSKELVIKEKDLVVANQKADTVRAITCDIIFLKPSFIIRIHFECSAP